MSENGGGDFINGPFLDLPLLPIIYNKRVSYYYLLDPACQGDLHTSWYHKGDNSEGFYCFKI